MTGQTGKYSSMPHKVATLMMLAAYLFVAFGNITLEVMHSGIHAWQNAQQSPQSQTHHHDLHSHNHSHGHHHYHHQHVFLEFLKRWVGTSSNENSPENVVNINIDKHLIEVAHFESRQVLQPLIKQLFYYSCQLLAKHSWPKIQPPKQS